MSNYNRCRWCGTPTHRVLCGHCVISVEQQLKECAWLAGQVQVNVTRQSQTGSRFRDGGRSTEKPLVFDDGASECGWVLHATLEPWAVQVRDMLAASPADPSTRGIARWLRYQVKYLTRLPEAGDLVGELNSVVSYGYKVIDTKEPRVYLGDCHCGQAVYGTGEEAWCWRCESVFRTEEWRKANAEAGRELLVTIREAALYLGEVYGIQATAQRMQRWRKHLTPRGVDAEGVTIYRLGDLLDHARNISLTLEQRRAEMLRKKLGYG